MRVCAKEYDSLNWLERCIGQHFGKLSGQLEEEEFGHWCGAFQSLDTAEIRTFFYLCCF